MDKNDLKKSFDLVFKIAQETKVFWDDSAGEYYRKSMNKYSEEIKKLLEDK